MYDTKNVLNQYKDGKNLNTRISLYQKYSTNSVNYSDWLQTNYDFFEGCKILEFGSGTGKDWKDNIDSLPEGVELILSDFSSGMVDELRQKYGNRDNVQVMQLDIQNANIKSNSIDFVIANSMLYHVPDIDKAISEMARILKDDGVFYAATSGDKGIFNFFKEHLKNISSDITLPHEVSFNLQNGSAYLEKYFTNVKINKYYNGLEVKNANDLVDFLYSMTSIIGLKDEHRDDIYNYFEKLNDENGNIVVEIEYGIFVAKKHA
jgi:ubiquinone/menaquinone biosynthesis C-methylase UbiE